MDVIKYITALLVFVSFLIWGTAGSVLESNKTEHLKNLEAYRSLQVTESLILSLSSTNLTQITEDPLSKQVEKVEPASFKPGHMKKKKNRVAKTNPKGRSRKNPRRKRPSKRTKNVGPLSDILHQKADDPIIKEDSEEKVEENIPPQQNCSFPASKANLAIPRMIKSVNLIYINYIWAKKGMSKGRSWFHPYYDVVESVKINENFRGFVQNKPFKNKTSVKECDVDLIFIGKLFVVTIDKVGKLGFYFRRSQKDITAAVVADIEDFARGMEWPIDCTTDYRKICHFLSECSTVSSMIPGILDHNLKKKLENNGALHRSNMTIKNFLKRSAKFKRLHNV